LKRLTGIRAGYPGRPAYPRSSRLIQRGKSTLLLGKSDAPMTLVNQKLFADGAGRPVLIEMLL